MTLKTIRGKVNLKGPLFKFVVPALSTGVALMLLGWTVNSYLPVFQIALACRVWAVATTPQGRHPEQGTMRQAPRSRKEGVKEVAEVQHSDSPDQPAVHIDPSSQPSPVSRPLVPVLPPAELDDIVPVSENVTIPFTLVQPDAPRLPERNVFGGAICTAPLDCRITDARKDLVCESLDSAPSNMEKSREERSQPAGMVHERDGVYLAGFGAAGAAKGLPK